MKSVLTAVLVTVAWLAPGVAYPCGGSGQGSCDWFNPHVTFTLAETADGLALSSVVQGCAGMRAAHQDRIEAEVARAGKGEACEGCPFGVQGLSFSLERTDLGTLVRIKGPKDRLAEFQKRFDARMAAREEGPSEGGCGCARAAGTGGSGRSSGPGSAPTCGD